ncbi:unnamed protein product [Prorocentrum cordatum]|uniref:Uncharacterized protein n=1 Tax=Prorocentrum cordatum TaxID=2364126 RepID=A0ABN9RX22_9DINO|nr:unnamed protein product [Polarella glacialis]
MRLFGATSCAIMPKAFPMEAASLPACGMKSFGVSMEHAGHTNDVMVAAWDKAKPLPTFEVLAKPEVVGDVDRAGAATFWDFPIKQWSFSARRPIKGQSDVPCAMSMHVSKSLPDGHYLVVKVFTFLGGGEPMAAVRDKLVEGEPCVLDYRPDTFNTVRTLQVADKKAALDRAWDYVQAEAPRGNFDGQRLLWVEHQFVDPDSPLYNMKREFVNSLLKCIADRDHFAVKEEYYPLLKPDIRDEYQPMTNKILQTLSGNTLLTIGEAGFGNTPDMYILAMAMARYHADAANDRRPGRAQAAVRVSAEIKFFRGEVGEPGAPCIFDDGDLADQRPRVLKAFFDPTQAESMTYVRWGTAKFVRGQARFGGGNEYNASAEPSAEEWAFASTSPDAAKRTTAFFLEMIRPAFPKGMSESNLGAMLERCNVGLNTKVSFFYRPAGKDSAVEKLPLMASYIKPEAGNILMQYLKHKKCRDKEEHDRLLAFEKRDMLQLMAESRAAAVAGDSGGGAAAAAAASSGPASAAAPRAADTASAEEAAPAGRPYEDEEDVFGFGGGMSQHEPTPPRQLTAARGALVKGAIASEEQRAIFASIVAEADGETLTVDDGGLDVEAEMEAMLDADEAARADGSARNPAGQTE